MTASRRLSPKQDSFAARTRPTLEGKDKRIIDFFQLRTPNMMDHLERINDDYFYEILYPEKTTIKEPKTCHLVCICIYEYINWITESVGDGRAPTVGCRTSRPCDLIMCFCMWLSCCFPDTSDSSSPCWLHVDERRARSVKLCDQCVFLSLESHAACTWEPVLQLVFESCINCNRSCPMSSSYRFSVSHPIADQTSEYHNQF